MFLEKPNFSSFNTKDFRIPSSVMLAETELKVESKDNNKILLFFIILNFILTVLKLISKNLKVK